MGEKRTILITGCSDGTLGSALALALHRLGWRVFASARNPSKLSATAAAGIEGVQLDVCSEASIAACVERVKQLTGGGPLDGLVNNAGAAYSMPVVHLETDKLAALFELNVYSLPRVTRAFLPLLLKSPRGALVANNISGASLLNCASPWYYVKLQGAYAASKAAALSLTNNLRIELAPFGVRVVALITGAVESQFWANTPRYELPRDSIYAVAREAIEAPMNGQRAEMKPGDAATWARQVAADLSRGKPPHLVFRGSQSGTARLVSLLPLGVTDGILGRMAGVDVLESRIRDQGVLEKLREGGVSG
ncbi:hypothetical protein F4778DRAFT_795205 [Xylariomycetidae sp. FL2044]|nr:hypothetical protein F4778DRAFT_795205 [Xylariomycetidae sp. FL2044]